MNITTYNIKTNDKLNINNLADATKIYSLEIDDNYDIKELDKLIIYSSGIKIWSIELKSILLDINKIIVENNKIIFSNDLFFQNDDYIYSYLSKYYNIDIIIISNKSINCKINLIHKVIENNLNPYNTYDYNINDYSYKKINSDKIIDSKFINEYNCKHVDLIHNISSFYMKGSRIYKIYYNDNINYKIIKKNIIFNDKNIGIIETIRSLKLMKYIQNIILEYCDIYEYVYKLDFNINIQYNSYTNIKLTFDIPFYGEILIIRNNVFRIKNQISYKFIDYY